MCTRFAVGREATVKLEDTGIYPFIKDCPECQILYRFGKGECITNSVARNEDYWYIIEGNIEVVASSHSGKRVHVDDNMEDEFTGHLSKYWGQNFYCDCIAATPCTLIRIPNSLFAKLIKQDDFRLFFYFKMSSRLYEMYRRRLSYDLFTPRQRFATHLLVEQRDGECYISNLSKECSELGISRRNLYNILDDFEGGGVISYEQTGLIKIKSMERLLEIARPAVEFMENN